MKKRRILFAFLLFVSFQAAAQMQITGTVTGVDDGLSIPGVSVVVKGNTSIGTTTDIDGKYSITVPSSTEAIVFSFVGMKTIEAPINGQSVINIQMESDVMEMDEVIVVGFGTQIKRNLSGAITKVETQDLKNVSVNSFESAIQGQTSGVFIEKASGKLGEAIKMRIRGSSSVSADNQPLYVIDGMPVTSQDQGVNSNQPTSPLADINFNDIESLQILKDASAAAIYGSRASNGVVLITTKSGKSGQTKYNFDISTGLSKPARLKEWLNSDEYFELFDEAIANVADPNTGLVWDWLDRDGLYDYYIEGWDGGYDTDWQSLAFQDAPVLNANLSASGGNEKTSFFAGLSYNDEQGILVNNDFNRIGGRIRLDHKASDHFEIGAGMSLTRTEMNRVANDNAFATPLQLVAMPPIQPAYDPDTGDPFYGTVYYNGLRSVKWSNENTKTFRNLSNAYLQYNIVGGLKFRSEFGIDLLDQRENNFYGRETIGAGPGGEGASRTVNVVNYNTNNYFSYDANFNEKHNLGFVLGTAYQQMDRDRNYIYAKNFPTDQLQTLASASEPVTFESDLTSTAYLSYFARSNYNLLNRYLFTLSGRMDGSSRFGDNNKYGFFPAGSVGWIISDENFMSSLSFISFLKARFSLGVTGNSGIGNFDHLALWGPVNYAGVSGLKPLSLPNPDLKWEKTTQYDVGIDFGFFNNRINGEFDYYYKLTTDLLLNRMLPATSGYTYITENIGELENKGFEISINTANTTGRFKWNTNINFSINQNKVLKLDGSDIIEGVNRVKEGYPIGVFEMVKYAGVDPANGDALWYVGDGSDATTSNYGDARKQIVGDPNPDFIGGFNNDFSYKGIDLKIITNFVYGNKIFNAGGIYQSANAEWWDNQTKDQLDRWQQPGDITDVPQARFGESNGSQESSRYLSDGSYLRIKNITLGYTLPKRFADKIFVNNLRIYVSVINLFTLTDYAGWDPEVNFTGTDRTTQSANIIQGRDFYTVPQSRTFSIGINMGF